ncbi:DUF6493 family protein [Streptomyces purpureus]|uniref:Uncharacterized protein n=1 Tax=Streptomyces purpureus TaxID=1951 RepID=A0A918H6U1_9ACTN|nr:DUF6493 family protein [Streptomyces purpureus]GGT42354.1 hypothetical protein GCM10014713_40080 [Streptomyces purpureus]
MTLTDTESVAAVTPVDELMTAVREGHHETLPGLLKALDAAGRKAALARLKKLRAEMRGWEWDRWQERTRLQRGLLVAGAGCHTGAAAAAAWIGARDLRRWDTLPTDLLTEVLADRDPVWLGDVAHRLAGRTSTAAQDYAFIRRLVEFSGCAVPTTDGYVHGWAGAIRGTGLLKCLRADAHTPVLVPRLFETAELADQLAWSATPDQADGWPAVLAALCEEGLVERSLLVDAVVSRLLRGGKPGDLKFFLVVLRRLALTAAEERDRTADWIGMAADGPSTVAGHAQAVLARLAESGELPARALADMSASVLFRTEKKLVRAQLVLLGKVLRRDRASAAELLPVIAEAFGHEDTVVQERALKLVGTVLPAVGDELRAELAGAAALLSPVHREAAVAVFGAGTADARDDGPYEELLPPVPERTRLAPPAATRAELLEAVVVSLRSRQDDASDVTHVERTLDDLVRHAHQDREGLVRELRPLAENEWWYPYRDHHVDNLPPVATVVAALVGTIRRKALEKELSPQRMPAPDCVHTALALIPTARAREAALLAVTTPPPFLLATPTWHTGALDAQELVDRLTVYRDLGLEPAPADFAQALLRVRRGQPEAAAAAGLLGTPAGERLASWLAAEEPAPPALRRVDEPVERTSPRWTWHYPSVPRIVMETRKRLVLQRDFPLPFHVLGRPHSTSAYCSHWWTGDGQWTAILPHDRESVAVWLLNAVTACADLDDRGGTRSLPLLVESDGEAGPALHLALATALGARHAEDRLVAVDALLVLAARGELDTARLGGDLAELVGLGTVKVNRLVDSVRTAAATGAYATMWSVLAAALPGILAGDPAPRGLGEVLAVAADCAERCGAGGAIPGLDGPAGRSGGSQLVVQAKRLRTALARDAEQPVSEPSQISH